MENYKNDLVTIGQLSRRLKVPVLWLRRQADRGVLPCVDADGKLFFNLETVKMKMAALAAKGASNE